MEYKLDNTVVKFTSNKPNVLKKVIIFGIIIAYLAYVVVTKGIKNSFWEFAFILFSLSLSLFFISLRSKTKNPLKLIKLLIRSTGKKTVLDSLPVSVEVNNDKLVVKIESAEIIKGKIISETFNFSKDDIQNINIFTLDNLIHIQANNCSIELNGESYSKIIQNGKTELFVYLRDTGPEIFRLLTEAEYKITDAKKEAQKEKDYQRQRKEEADARKEERMNSKDKSALEEKMDKIQEKNPNLASAMDSIVNGFDEDVDNDNKY